MLKYVINGETLERLVKFNKDNDDDNDNDDDEEGSAIWREYCTLSFP